MTALSHFARWGRAEQKHREETRAKFREGCRRADGRAGERAGDGRMGNRPNLLKSWLRQAPVVPSDQMARMMQAAIQKNNLMKQPMVVSLKGGASGAEALMYMKSSEGDPNKVMIARIR